MAVAAVTAFPASIVAGDTLRVSYSDGDYPSGSWTLQVSFRGPSHQIFTATAAANNAYSIVLPAADTAKLKPGAYIVTFIYTSGGERISAHYGNVQVVTDPTKPAEKTQARRTLEKMESALESLAAGSNATVSFNGQSFSKKNLKELQDAIERQRAIVASEEAGSLAAGTRRYTGIGVRFARPNGYYNEYCDW